MSSIKLSPNASGTGEFTIAAPNSNTNRTLTLPDNTGTVLTTGSTGQVIPKAALPTGSVLQVVNATYSTYVSTGSTSYVDTGLSATITPSSVASKVLIFANVPDAHNNVTASILYLNVVRNSTQIIEFAKHSDHLGSGASLVTYGGSTSYLDSPNTTSATTYKVQFKVNSGSQALFLNNGVGTITLMEIAA